MAEIPLKGKETAIYYSRAPLFVEESQGHEKKKSHDAWAVLPSGSCKKFFLPHEKWIINVPLTKYSNYVIV